MTMAGLFKRVTRKQEQRDELLSAYLDGQLSAGERMRLEAQLADDPALRAEFEALRHTVALVRSLPPLPVPRNFILSQRIAAHPRPARLLRPRYTWAAPLLTAATAVVGLVCVAVLAGDLLLSGAGRMAFAPAAAPMEPPQVALSPTQVVAEAAVEVEVTAQVEKVVPATAAPALSVEVPPREVAPAATAEAEPYVMETPARMEAPGASAAPAPTPSPLPMLAVAPTSPPMPEGMETAMPAAGGGPTEAPAVPAPTASPLVAAEAVPSPTASATVTTLQQQDMGSAAPTPGEVAEVAPPAAVEEELRAPEGGRGAETATPAAIAPWRTLEAILGLTTLGLALATVWAWRARRR